jgi:hypothetical protein
MFAGFFPNGKANPAIDMNSLWGGLTIQKREFCVKGNGGNCAQGPGFESRPCAL